MLWEVSLGGIERSWKSEHPLSSGLWNSVLNCFRWPEYRLYKDYRNQGAKRRILDAVCAGRNCKYGPSRRTPLVLFWFPLHATFASR